MKTGLDTGFEVMTLPGIGTTLLPLHITGSHLAVVPAFQRIIHGLSPEPIVERVLPRRFIKNALYMMQKACQS